VKNKKAQTLAEYAITAGIIAIVLAAMGTPFKRTIQQIVKSTADAIGYQSESEQASKPDDGYLDFSETNSDITSSKMSDEVQGVYTGSEQEITVTQTNTLTNMGSTEQ